MVFEPGDSFMSEKAKREYIIQRDKEHIGFEGFRAALVDTGIIGVGNTFDVKYFSVKDFMENFEMSDAKARYLSRYVLEG
ncbi:MAG: hypothetical protein E7254_11705 [Lachnospiraceae bacterium]|nr:hypothetical protein [Lachnospiraceae bacterium]